MGKSSGIYGSIDNKGEGEVSELLIHASQKSILNPISNFITEKGIEEEILKHISEEQYENLLNELDACLDSWNEYNHKTLIFGVIYLVISIVLLILITLDLVIIVVAAIIDNGTMAVVLSILLVGLMVGAFVLPCISLPLLLITFLLNQSKTTSKLRSKVEDLNSSFSKNECVSIVLHEPRTLKLAQNDPKKSWTVEIIPLNKKNDAV